MPQSEGASKIGGSPGYSINAMQLIHPERVLSSDRFALEPILTKHAGELFEPLGPEPVEGLLIRGPERLNQFPQGTAGTPLGLD